MVNTKSKNGKSRKIKSAVKRNGTSLKTKKGSIPALVKAFDAARKENVDLSFIK